MKIPTSLPTTILLCLLAGGSKDCIAETSGSFVGASNPCYQYLGSWHTNSTGYYTIYPGSQVRFCLKGKARLVLQPGMPGTIRAAVRRNGDVVWDGFPDHEQLDLDGGTLSTPFTVLYLMTNKRGFDPARAEAKGAEFCFGGLILDHEAAVTPPPEPRNSILLDFIGDSITAGTVILGRSGSWSENSNVALTYAFLLAERLQANYRIRGFPGIGCDEIASKVPFFRKSLPLPRDPRPDIVFVNIAANDREKQSNVYRGQMRNLLDVIFTTYPETHIVLLNFCRMTPNRLPVLQELASLYSSGKVVCFDARPYLVGYSDKGVHPDADSHNRLSEALAAYVKRTFLQELPVTTNTRQNPTQARGQ